jgi:hypothetical protein
MCSTEGEEIYSIGMTLHPSCSSSSGEILACNNRHDVPCMLHFMVLVNDTYVRIAYKEATYVGVLVFKYNMLLWHVLISALLNPWNFTSL